MTSTDSTGIRETVLMKSLFLTLWNRQRIFLCNENLKFYIKYG